MWHDSVSGLQWIANDNAQQDKPSSSSSQRSDVSNHSGSVNGDANTEGVAEESFTEGDT